MNFKILFFILTILPLSVSAGDDPLNSWRARIALFGAGLLNTAIDFTNSIWNTHEDLVEAAPVEEETAEIVPVAEDPEIKALEAELEALEAELEALEAELEELQARLEQLQAQNPQRVAELEALQAQNPQRVAELEALEAQNAALKEPYERRYLPNGIDINDEWAREVDLPTTHNNCAAFGIYGRNNVTRQEIVQDLLQAAQGNGDLAIHIRTLVAPEILGYLVDAQTDEIRQERMRLLLSNGVIFNLLNTAWENNDNEQLLKILRNQHIFTNYINNVVGRRLGDSEEDSYPELTMIIEGGSLFGVIAAIAAQQGVTLNIHARVNRQIVPRGTYNHIPRLTPGLQHRVVDLIHTTADPIFAPNALNHFNLLERCGAFLPVFQEQKLETDPSLYLQSWSVESEDLTAFVIAHEDVKRWVSKLGLMCQSSQSGCNYSDLNDSVELAFLEIRGHLLEDSIDGPIHFHPEITLQILCERWARSLSQFQSLAIGLKFFELYNFPNEILNKPLHQCNQELHPVLVSLAVIVDMLKALQLMTPNAQRVQLLILILDKTIHLYSQELQDRKNIFHQNGVLLERVKDYQHAFQDFQKNKLLKKGISVEDAKSKLSDFYFHSYRCEGRILIYILEQLIDFCRINGYEPVVPHYIPLRSDIIKNFINDRIVLTAVNAKSYQNAVQEQAENKLKGWTKKAKKKKRAQVQPRKKTPAIRPQSNAVAINANSTMAIDLNDTIISDLEVNEAPGLTPCLNESFAEEVIEEIKHSEIPEEIAEIFELAVHQEGITEDEETEEDEAIVEDEDIAEHNAFIEEMRQKKKSQQHNRSHAVSYRTIQWIGALLPEERNAFEGYLLAHMTFEEREIYNAFVNAEHNVLTLRDVDAFALFMTNYLRGFLRGQFHPNGQRVYTDQAVNVFVESLGEGHKKSEHHWHNPGGKKVDGSWIKYRYRSWIEHGVLESRGATRTDSTATATLAHRLGQRQRTVDNVELFEEIEKSMKSHKKK